jgi:hypothetical protein
MPDEFSAGKAIQTTAQEKICTGKWACLALCEEDRLFYLRAQTENLEEL